MKFIFNKTNLILFILGVIGLIIGYAIMGTGDSVLSPVILVITYVIIFPAAILTGLKKKKD
ncbi:MAG: hypothetical protein DRZ79_04300 [Candidatus Cloacimonadota bacterium]|nr:MAG: hypothetical protein DRZ79_04300 [Candidatus Cloacimonadota bacterium]